MPTEMLHPVQIVIEPKTKADQEKMGVALHRLAAEDPSFRVTSDQESGQTIIKGMGELHLEILVDRMEREFKVDANVGAPQVAYRESLAKPVEVTYTHKKQSGGSGQFGEVRVQLEPSERGSGIDFLDEIKGGNIPREYIPAVEKGMRETAEGGHLIGFPIIDFKIRLIDGKYHDVDSSALAFEITGRGAMREAAAKAGIKLLEPIMKVEVVTPDHLAQKVATELANRGATNLNIGIGPTSLITAIAPMACLFGFEIGLKGLSSEVHTVVIIDHYGEVQANPSDPDDHFPVAAALRA